MKLIRNPYLGIFLALGWVMLANPLDAQTRLLRFPDIHGERVVFTYAGDLWTASSKGGVAVRLTAHPGQELFAKFSPDGKWIAFTGQYDGDEQVYVIPSTGGVPKQLTFYPARGPLPPRWGYDHQVYGWTPDGKNVLFRSLRDSWTLGRTHLYSVPAAGGLPTMLPMPESGGGDYSPDGKMVVYSPLARDFRAWKRYQGGWAQDLYTFDLASHQIQPVAHSPRTERDPMWIGNKIYFDSDRTGTLNLYEFDIASQKVRQLTNYTKWDVRWPSKGENGEIVFELDGELNVYDTKKGGEPVKLSINVPDDGLAMRPSQISAAKNIEDFSLSPKGERALFVARGDVFTAPIEKGPTRNLTHSSDAHDKQAAWSPDGAKIAFLSDRTGEDELYLVDQNGEGKLEQLTNDGKRMRYRPVWSPDGKRIAFSDSEGKLYFINLDDKKVTQIADEQRGLIRDQVWSPDGNFIAYTMSGPGEQDSIHVYSVAEGRDHTVTGDLWNENSPAWDPDGKYLFYMSDREYAPQISTLEFNFAGNRMTGIFALTLQKDGPNPFPPESDEVTIVKKDEKKDEKKDAEKKPETKPGELKPVTIDWDGLESRVTRVPVAASNYGGLAAIKDHLIYVEVGSFYYGRESAQRPKVVIYSMKDRKATTLVEGARGYDISADGKKILVREGAAFNLYDATPKGQASKKTVSTAGLVVDRIPAQEWRQIFNEVWRRYRDFFYVTNMHGYDWEALRQQYAPLLEYVAHRSDLNYVIGEMIGELNIGHTYIVGGDYDIPERPEIALPGARFTLDEAAGRYKIAKIFQGQNEEPTYRSPLTEVGVNVSVGDYVLAINGEDLTANINPYSLLRGKAGRQVRLTVNAKPDTNGAHDAVFTPISTEEHLIYLEMVERNRQRVDKLSNGRVGYIQIPDMGAEGISEFIKWYYPQIRKEGLVVDDRSNGGGNVSRMIIERLRRKLLATGFSRTSDFASTYPDEVFYGPMACLLNEDSASDGDIFPAMFRQAGLGPLIGKRSWGGVTGITNRGTLIDGGQVNVPEFGFASVDGKWIIEGTGVVPDIEVENDPESVIEGKDPQLERGVAEVLKAIQANPKKLPERPPAPVKTK